MALVQLASQGWSPVVDSSGNARPAVAFTLETLAGATAAIYSDSLKTSVLVTADKVTLANGVVPGWAEPGTYVLTIGGVTERVEIVGGRTGFVVADTVGDGVVDDTAAIIAALDALPDYGGGYGGGTVLIPNTPTNICKATVGAIVLGDGQRLIGGGMQAPRILGNGAGDLITVTGSFAALEHLFVHNQSANIAARAMDVRDNSNFEMRRVYFQAANAGGAIVRLHAALLVQAEGCKTGGSGTAVCDVGLLADSECNGLSLHACRFTDSKSGAAIWGIRGLDISGCCQFEANAGGGTYQASLALSKVLGGSIKGNYFEASPTYAIVTFTAVNYSEGIEIGGNTLQGISGGSFIVMDGARESTVLSNYCEPSVANPNPNGVLNQGTYAHTNTINPQRLTSGTGVETLGGITRRAGPGSPEGVVKAYPGSTWNRTDGGAGTGFYVKESGAGTNTGWVAK